MKFLIDQKVFDEYPDLRIGAIIVRDFDNSRRISAIESLLRGISAQRGKEFAEKELSEEKAVSLWNQAYGKFGINPKKCMPSIAALLKRVSAGKDLPSINSIVNLYNYFSLKYLLPIGGEDMDWLYGDLTLTYTKGGEAFRPLGTVEIEEAHEGEIAYMDKGGITCRYWNHRECERTKFTEKTRNALILVEDLGLYHLDSFGEIVNDIAATISKYLGGRIEAYILSEEAPQLDLGVEGRTSANDAKVSAQEKAFFQEMQKRLNKKS